MDGVPNKCKKHRNSRNMVHQLYIHIWTVWTVPLIMHKKNKQTKTCWKYFRSNVREAYIWLIKGRLKVKYIYTKIDITYNKSYAHLFKQRDEISKAHGLQHHVVKPLLSRERDKRKDWSMETFSVLCITLLDVTY